MDANPSTSEQGEYGRRICGLCFLPYAGENCGCESEDYIHSLDMITAPCSAEPRRVRGHDAPLRGSLLFGGGS